MRLIFSGAPLSVNQTYKRGKGTSIYLSQKARQYGEDMRKQAKLQWRGKPITADVEVSFYYYFADKKIHDHLNYNKCLSDSLNQIVWQDDRQIKISHHYTLFDGENPRVEIEINEIKPV
jgi:Holliday junction resolvase RusA-like endonuclease